MPLSGRPARITGPILFPSTSVVTSFDRVRSGPVSPPPASRPWQNEQFCRKSAPPLLTKSCGYGLNAASEAGLLAAGFVFVGCCADIWPMKRAGSSSAASSTLLRMAKQKEVIPQCILGLIVTIGLNELPEKSECSRLRMRRRAAVGHTQHPLDRFKIHLANVRIVPRFFGMAEGGIKDSSLAIHFAPRHGE